MEEKKSTLDWHKNKTTFELYQMTLQFGLKGTEKMSREELIQELENHPYATKDNKPQKLFVFNSDGNPEKTDAVLFLTEKKTEKLRTLCHRFVDSLFDVLKDRI